MKLTFGSNIAALQLARRLSDNSRDLGSTFQRLSSGSRINSASDDSAGLAVSSALKADTRIFSQALRNANDAISALNIADGALGQLSTVAVRLKELAQQAANGSLSLTQRRTLDTEAYQLTQEWNRLTGSTSFNGLKLLNGQFGQMNIQLGYGDGSTLSAGIGNELSHGVGTGTFQTSTSFTATSVLGVVSADLNGDGKLDLVSGRNGSAVFDVRLGNGDGTFQTEVSYASSSISSLFHMKLVDVNNDGNLDYVGANTSTSAIAVALGNGNGTFQTAISYALSSAVSGLAAGDLNGDGFADLAISSGTGASGLMTVLNSGTGTFGAATAYALGKAGGISIADFTGDGINDIAVSRSDAFETYILQNNGSASFTTTQTITTASIALYHASGDVNHDGLADLVLGAVDKTFLYQGTGTSTMAALTTLLNPYNQGRVYLQDINADGNLDIVAAGNNAFAQLHTFIGRGDGSFADATTSGSGLTNIVTYLAFGDFDGNGSLDIAGDRPASNVIHIFQANTEQATTLQRFDLTTASAARSTLDMLDDVIDRISSEQGSVGALITRLETAVNTISAARDNYAAAGSRITDIDVAEETSQMVRRQILQQTTTALLAQANAMPQIALSLLQNA